MLPSFINKLEGWASGPNIIVLGLIVALFNTLVFPNLDASLASAGAQAKPLDLLFSYTTETAYSMIESYGSQGRQAYVIAQLTADTLYPIAYALFLSLAMIYVFRRAFEAFWRFNREVLRFLKAN